MCNENIGAVVFLKWKSWRSKHTQKIKGMQTIHTMTTCANFQCINPFFQAVNRNNAETRMRGRKFGLLIFIITLFWDTMSFIILTLFLDTISFMISRTQLIAGNQLSLRFCFKSSVYGFESPSSTRSNHLFYGWVGPVEICFVSCPMALWLRE